MMYAEAGEGTGEARLVFAFVARGPSGHARCEGLGGGATPETLMENKTSNKTRTFTVSSCFLFSIFTMKSR